ncbi:MAG: hypothetical protein WAO77_07135 [Sphingobium sp.]|uniref:hypothetical protein n=1 Tax=Sphingobium sp. TaxID=1912891 RepID=UPI003BB1800D
MKTPVRGLPRADRQRSPIGVGEVIALPADRAMELGGFGAIEPTEAEVTIPLNWSALASSLTTPIAVVAVTDRYALVDAIGELGGTVFFPGDGLPDHAEAALVDFSNEQLRAELESRVEEGRLSPVWPMGKPVFVGVDLAAGPDTTVEIALPPGIEGAELAGDGAGKALSPIAEEGAAESSGAAAPASRKPTRKNKAAAE